MHSSVVEHVRSTGFHLSPAPFKKIKVKQYHSRHKRFPSLQWYVKVKYTPTFHPIGMFPKAALFIPCAKESSPRTCQLNPSVKLLQDVKLSGSGCWAKSRFFWSLCSRDRELAVGCPLLGPAATVSPGWKNEGQIVLQVLCWGSSFCLEMEGFPLYSL